MATRLISLPASSPSRSRVGCCCPTPRDQLKNRADVGLISVGRFRLKNVGRPLELYAVSADGLVVPDPRALEGKGDRYANLPNSLPDPGPPLLGRSADLVELVELVRGSRVVTVTGPGGVGKTCVLAARGRVLVPEFLDGATRLAKGAHRVNWAATRRVR